MNYEFKKNINIVKEKSYIFSLKLVELVSTLPENITGDILGKQLTRAAISIGANLEEALVSSKEKECTNFINIAKREASETEYRLKQLGEALKPPNNETCLLLSELDEITKILTSIIKSSQENF